jgi:hypothetical protein
MNKMISDQYDWDELLDLISERKLTPIIGSELYNYNDKGTVCSLDDYLSNKLLELFRISDQPGLSLTQAVNYLEYEKKIKTLDVIRRLKTIVKEINFDFPALDDFLKITDLKYYVNTTVYNSILEKKINEIQGLNATSINFSINEPFKDSDALESLTEPFVFNVFGSILNTVDPALSEEDLLEYAGNFMLKMNGANNILNALQNKSLLFIGCAYPEWLIRFALRLLSNEPMNLWGSRRSVIVINDNTPYRQKLYDVLKNYEVITYEGSTAEFAKELTRQWKERNPNSQKKKTVFLSYTRADKEAVENMKKEIEQLGNISCWYDNKELEPGDDWREKIVVNIRQSDIFMPLLSANSLEHEDGYVQKEWSQGVNEWIFRNHDKKEGKYLIPVVIDDSQLYSDKISKHFDPKINISKVPGGKPSPDFLSDIKKILNLS